MRLSGGRAFRRLTRQHVEGAAVGLLVSGAIVGTVFGTTIATMSRDVRWLGRRLVEKRRLIEDQRAQLAAVSAAVHHASRSLEEAAARFEPASDGLLEGEELPAAYDPGTLPFVGSETSEVGAALERLIRAGGELAARGDEAGFAVAVGRHGGGVAGDVPSAWPVRGRVSSSFGMRRAPIRGGWRMHPGLDIKAPFGTPVAAAGAGRVVFAGRRTGYGRTVVIDHGDGLRTLYAHLSRLRVREGAWVDDGAAVGTVGSSGRSTGPHLHYEVRFRGEAVNPMCYLGEPPPSWRDDAPLTTRG